MIRMPSSWSGLPQAPNIIAPRQSGETWTPVRPSGRYSIAPTVPVSVRGMAPFSYARRRMRGRRPGAVADTGLVGNRLALAGAILYFLEWVAIPFLPATQPTDKLGHGTAAIVHAYSSHPGVTALAAGWFSFVLLGRFVFIAGLRSAFRDTSRELTLLDVALVAMGVGVALEIASFALAASAAWLAQARAGSAAMVSLDAASSILDRMIYAPTGLAILGGAAAMLLSKRFAAWLGWLGILSGT